MQRPALASPAAPDHPIRPDPSAAMRKLPPEAIHLPFEPGPYRMAMDLVTRPESAWFELDDRYHAEMAEKRHLLATAHPEVFAATSLSDAAREETLNLVSAA